MGYEELTPDMIRTAIVVMDACNDPEWSARLREMLEEVISDGVE